MSKNPWAYTIDYDKAIAEDEAQVELYRDGGVMDRVMIAARQTELVSRYLAARGQESCMAFRNVFDVLVMASAVGVAEYDAIVTALGTEIDPTFILSEVLLDGNVPFVAELEARHDATIGRQRFARAGEEQRRVDALLLTEIIPDEDRRRCLKKAKTRLARHRRNKSAHS